MQEQREPEMRRDSKDSVFCDMFRDKERIFRAFRENMHPEMTEVTPEDIVPVTLRPVLMRTLRNDLAFLVRERVPVHPDKREAKEFRMRYRLIILVEAQATWTLNILIRFLLYLAAEYQRYVKEYGLNLFGTKVADLPEPEFYVVYCGPPNDVKDRISLREDVFRNSNAKLDLVATVIHRPEKGGILGEYIVFCRVLDEQVRLYGRSVRAVEETIRICKDRDVLREYLERREKEEIFGMMQAMFSEKDYQRAIENSLREAKAEGLAEGLAEGEKSGAIRTFIEDWQEFGKTHAETIKRLAEKFHLGEAAAEEKMTEYWRTA